METSNHLFPWLKLMDRPAFCVKDGVVTAANTAARHRIILPGTDVREIVTVHRDTYEKFENGCLFLTITVGGFPCNASVTRTLECDIFIIHQDTDNDQLQTLALAAQQLRIPLSNVMTVADRLLSNLDEEDLNAQQQASQINHGLFQLLRIINNMSDTVGYQNAQPSSMQTIDLTAVVDEILEKVQTVSASTGTVLSYSSPDTPILGLANEEKLERAIYNLLSNALKFSPAGSTVEAKLTKSGNLLSFTVCNTNIADAEDHGFWNRYRREPAIEDSRYGLGLGMKLVSAVAAAHGGTVLIDHPSGGQTRVTMTIAIVKDSSGSVRSPILPIGDYAGGRDKALLEFAEILPTDSYEKIN